MKKADSGAVNTPWVPTIAWGIAFLLCLLHTGAITAQQGLAPAVQGDLLRDKIYTQVKSNDADAILVSLDQYHKLARDSNLAFPIPLYWIEAKAAHEAGDATRALSALGDFLNHADRGSDQYKEALTLYPKYQQDAAGAKGQQIDARREALVTRIPAVLNDIRNQLAMFPGGILELQQKHLSLVDELVNISGHSEVRPFSITRAAVSNLLWDVYCADVGCASKDNWSGNSEVARFKVAKEPYELAVWMGAHLHEAWRLPTESELIFGAWSEVQFHDSEGKKGSAVSLISHLPGPIENQIVSVCWDPSPGEVIAGKAHVNRISHCDATRTLLLGAYNARLVLNVRYAVLRRKSVEDGAGEGFIARLVKQE